MAAQRVQRLVFAPEVECLPDELHLVCLRLLRAVLAMRDLSRFTGSDSSERSCTPFLEGLGESATGFEQVAGCVYEESA